MIRIIGVGDIMPGGLLHCSSQNYITEEVSRALKNADLRVGTLECAIGDEPTFVEDKMSRAADIVYAPTEDLKRLADLNVNVVSLANNHAFDLGMPGLEHTIGLLDELGIFHVGAGRNIEEAQKPAVVTVHDKKIAFLAFCDVNSYIGWIPQAGKDTPGVNPLIEEYVLEEIAKTKKLYDYVVVLPHWGIEHQYNPTSWVVRLAKKMIRAGASAVLGSHPHRVQPIVPYRKRPIAFSMGNFLFPDRLIAPPQRVTYYPSEPLDLTLLPVTDGYPVVEEVTYKKWKSIARVGMVVELVIDQDRISAHHRLTCMDDSNVVSFCANVQVEKKLKDVKVKISYLPYGFYMRCRKLISSLKRR